MLKTSRWNDVKNELSPEVRAEANRIFKEDMEQMLLSQVRHLAGLTQQQVAKSLGTSQAYVSKLEKQNTSVQIDTLKKIVEALGGELEVIVKLPTGNIAITPTQSEKKRAA